MSGSTSPDSARQLADAGQDRIEDAIGIERDLHVVLADALGNGNFLVMRALHCRRKIRHAHARAAVSVEVAAIGADTGSFFQAANRESNWRIDTRPRYSARGAGRPTRRA